MTVYNQISSNITKTYLIIFLFIVILSGFFYIVGQFMGDAQSYFIIGLIIAFISSIGSYFYSDKLVLATVGAKPATKEEYFDFYTVAENLSMADGLPMPKLYVIESQAMNAFATGRNPKHAVVCVTSGILQRLDRSDLEGVIAHELSHVKNYDILVSTVVAVLVGTVALVANWLSRSIFWGGLDDNDRRSRNPLMLILFIIVLVTIPIAATLIQLAVSRRREYLADASGVLLTRNPEGLADALEKISADDRQLKTATVSTAHLFLSNPFKKNQRSSSWLANLFSTHPPIEERIRLLREM